MFQDPRELTSDLARVEQIEKASLRFVSHALFEFRDTAEEIFAKEPDLPQDIAEDITREALDRLGVSRMDLRLFGKIDYKRARFVFHPDYAVRQALFVDSKAEKERGTATLQTAQTSLRIRHVRATEIVDIPGEMPTFIDTPRGSCLTTTIIVKYVYEDEPTRLLNVIVAALPSGLLQHRYNPTASDTIWRTGRNAPTLGEPFRVRLVFADLKRKARWRVQAVPLRADAFAWDE
jgi:hypothetical protein